MFHQCNNCYIARIHEFSLEIPQPQQKPPKLKKGSKVFIVAVVAVIGAFFANGLFSSSIYNSVSNSRFIASATGFDHKVFANNVEMEINYTENTTTWINGTFHANGPVSFYAFNQSEYSELFSKGNFSPNLFAYEDRASGTVNVSFEPGTVYFILFNPNNGMIVINFSFTATKT